ncbi:hypothetical protein GGQ80_002806 [Sphingomonas jinjuensis]|uniref:Uncharacterized protein n=1 Tax=Sphingomonas jinjuensis TaxID=535907 RepID=A0A840FA38_9SPHN|nr:hypothetical protein [Sphingomonas jinjuensis]MBB4154890.1 hypothetical protein [Sphingomonas jinjuensis]
MDEQSRREEDELAARQDGRLYPLGRALRATYDAENHNTLGMDVTGLMLDLARVPYERDEGRRGDAVEPTVAPQQMARGSSPGWFERFRGLLGR